jgi:hypothetical protein
MNLAKSTKVTRVLIATALGTASVNGSVIDMQDFEGVVFTAQLGAITDGTPSLKAQEGTLPDGSDMTDLAGSNTPLAITDDEKCAVLEVYRPVKRYLRPVVVRGGATGSVIDSVIALQHSARVLPTTNDPATVAATNVLVSPLEGAA